MSRWWGFALGSAVVLAAGAALAGSPEPSPSKHKEKSFQFFNMETDSGYLGIVIKDLEGSSVRGARVEEVRDDSPAAKAGLKEGDVVVRFDGETVRSAEQLRRLVRETPPGRDVAVAVTRNGAEQKLTATLEKAHNQEFAERWPFAGAPPAPPGAPMPPDAPDFRFAPEDMGPGVREFHRELRMGPQHVALPGPRKLGVQYQEISGQLAKYFHVEGDEGILVVSVDENGPAAKAGVKAGDVIMKIDGKAVSDSEDVRREVSALESGKETSLTVQREGRPLDLKLTVGGKKPAPDPKSTT
jgi:S1-C subfamily serine protease